MENLVERMKARPRHERERYAFGISAGLTALMFLVWAVSAVPRSSTMMATAEAPQQEVSGPSPLSVLKDGVSQVAAAAQALLSQSTDVSIDLDAEYERIKAEVESGSINIVAPQEPAPRP
jgi:hypothetical protein